MFTHNKIRMALVKRVIQLVDNDRALFEQKMGPLSRDEELQIQEHIDGAIAQLQEVLVLMSKFTGECRTDIPRPLDA